MTRSTFMATVLLVASCGGERDRTRPVGGDTGPREDTAGPDAELPEGVSWSGSNDQRLGAALAVGPGATLVLSGPGQGNEYWEDTEEPRIYLLDATTGDLRADAFATIRGGYDPGWGTGLNTLLGTEVVLPGDVTGDGEPDLLLFTAPKDPDLAEPAYLFSGPLLDTIRVTDPGALPVSGPDGWGGAHCGDLDGNGVDELCLGSGVVFGPVGAAPEPMLTWSGSDAGSLDIAAADLDADGVKELIIADSASSALYRLAAHDPGDLDLASASEAVWSAPTGGFQAVVAGDDLDGDGQGDIALACSDGSTTTAYLLTDSGGGAIEEAATSIAVPATALASGDLDGDQNPDLIVGGAGSVRVFLGLLEPGVIASRDAAVHLVGTQAPDDGFGDTLVVLQRNGATTGELVVGAPDTLEDGSYLPFGMVFLVSGGVL